MPGLRGVKSHRFAEMSVHLPILMGLEASLEVDHAEALGTTRHGFEPREVFEAR